VIGKKKLRVILAEGEAFCASLQASIAVAASKFPISLVFDPLRTESVPPFSLPSELSFQRPAFSTSLRGPERMELKLSAAARNPPSLSNKTRAPVKPFGKI
jgi:hypothetical protein